MLMLVFGIMLYVVGVDVSVVVYAIVCVVEFAVVMVVW